MTLDPRGKVQVIRNTEALPAKCVICHKPVDGNRQFIDFGFDIDYYGQVLFCVECLSPVAEACGYVRYEDFKKLADALAIALDRGKELQEKYDNASNLLNGVLGYQPTFIVDADDVSNFDEEHLQDDDEKSEGSEPESLGPEPDSNESSTESGQRDISETTDDEPEQYESGITL